MITKEELWAMIPEFPQYQVSSYGRIYNSRFGRMLRTSRTTEGHVKVNLVSDRDQKKHTRSVPKLVAEAFVEPPTPRCDCVVLLDGDLFNVNAENLVWRPNWFAWKYARQVKTQQPDHYYNLPIINTVTGDKYDSIIETGMTEGLLFDDIWRSTYTGASIFPNTGIYAVDK